VSATAVPQPADTHLRLIWPQWQGAGSSSVRQFTTEFPFDVGRRGYAVGAKAAPEQVNIACGRLRDSARVQFVWPVTQPRPTSLHPDTATTWA